MILNLNMEVVHRGKNSEDDVTVQMSAAQGQTVVQPKIKTVTVNQTISEALK